MTRIERFRELHREGFFVVPNAWDVGSAVRLVAAGFPALATTSSGHAWSLGKEDQEVTFDELCAHVEAMCAAVDVPVSVDSERLFADDAAGIRDNVATLAGLGAAGLSIEDYDPSRDAVIGIDEARARVAAAADAAGETGVVLTARAENHLYGNDDLDDTIARLVAYRDAGADVVHAPGLREPDHIRRVVDQVGVPVNVLFLDGGPTADELAALGVRRASTGGRLARAAYSAAVAAAEELRDRS